MGHVKKAMEVSCSLDADGFRRSVRACHSLGLAEVGFRIGPEALLVYGCRGELLFCTRLLTESTTSSPRYHAFSVHALYSALCTDSLNKNSTLKVCFRAERADFEYFDPGAQLFLRSAVESLDMDSEETYRSNFEHWSQIGSDALWCDRICFSKVSQLRRFLSGSDKEGKISFSAPCASSVELELMACRSKGTKKLTFLTHAVAGGLRCRRVVPTQPLARMMNGLGTKGELQICFLPHRLVQVFFIHNGHVEAGVSILRLQSDPA